MSSYNGYTFVGNLYTIIFESGLLLLVFHDIELLLGSLFLYYPRGYFSSIFYRELYIYVLTEMFTLFEVLTGVNSC